MLFYRVINMENGSGMPVKSYAIKTKNGVKCRLLWPIQTDLGLMAVIDYLNVDHLGEERFEGAYRFSARDILVATGYVALTINDHFGVSPVRVFIRCAFAAEVEKYAVAPVEWRHDTNQRLQCHIHINYTYRENALREAGVDEDPFIRDLEIDDLPVIIPTEAENLKDMSLREFTRSQSSDNSGVGEKFDLKDLRAGAMRSSSTYAALIIQLEHDRFDQIRVLSTVMNALGISLEEVECFRRQPSGVDDSAQDRWNDEMDELEKKAPKPFIE
jgi:hypothetical protein